MPMALKPTCPQMVPTMTQTWAAILSKVAAVAPMLLAVPPMLFPIAAASAFGRPVKKIFRDPLIEGTEVRGQPDHRADANQLRHEVL